MSAGAITREIADAGVGVGRLIRYDPRWPEGFNPSAAGFLRSFIAPMLALPFFLVTTALTVHAIGDAPVTNPAMAGAAFGHVLSALVYPALIAAIARPLGVGAGYAGFVIVVNWASLFLNVALAVASLLTLGGQIGFNLFSLVWLALLGVSLFITWRAAHETLSPEVPIALLMVVLSVGVDVLADQVSTFAVGLVAPG